MTKLCVNFYRDRQPERQCEIDRCLVYNLDNPEIDSVVAVTDLHPLRLPSHPKLNWVLRPSRPTFNDLFNAVTASGDDFTVVANSDIYFDRNSIKFMNQKLHHHEAYAITRWDVKSDGSSELCTREGIAPLSQDAWAFRGEIRAINADFSPGILGCDNRLAQLMIEVGYTVINPSLTVKPYHLHMSEVRNYNSVDVIGGVYAEVPVSMGDIAGYTIGAPIHR